MDAVPSESAKREESSSQANDPGLARDESVSLDHGLNQLADELNEARSELADYQSLLQELPAIYEKKFRQQVHSTAQNIRQLLDERKALQEQVARALVAPMDQHQLPAAQGIPSKPRPRGGFDVSLPAFLSSSKHVPLHASLTKTPRLVMRIPRLWRFVLLGSALVAFAIFFGAVFWPQRQPLPSAIRPERRVGLPAAATVKLMARGGQAWILVEDFAGAIVLDAVLNEGETRTLDIGKGLKIRSGRPDLVFFGVDSAPAKQLGDVSDLDWTEIRPPA